MSSVEDGDISNVLGSPELNPPRRAPILRWITRGRKKSRLCSRPSSS